MALEEPFIVNIEHKPNELATGKNINVGFDNKEFYEIYLLSKIVIPSPDKKVSSGIYTVNIPGFEINGIKKLPSTYTFHFDKEKLVKKMKNSYRCASLTQIFSVAISKDAGYGWMFPKISAD